MKILLAAATGAVGHQLVSLWAAAGHEVSGTTRHPKQAGDLAALAA